MSQQQQQKKIDLDPQPCVLSIILVVFKHFLVQFITLIFSCCLRYTHDFTKQYLLLYEMCADNLQSSLLITNFRTSKPCAMIPMKCSIL